jgi:hypothetical protein
MMPSAGECLFLLCPVVLAALLLWRWPESRRVRVGSPILYGVIVGGVIGATLALVAHIASARVPWTEVAVVLWFTIAWAYGQWRRWGTGR